MVCLICLAVCARQILLPHIGILKFENVGTDHEVIHAWRDKSCISVRLKDGKSEGRITLKGKAYYVEFGVGHTDVYCDKDAKINREGTVGEVRKTVVGIRQDQFIMNIGGHYALLELDGWQRIEDLSTGFRWKPWNCAFRKNSATNSKRIRPPIPMETGHVQLLISSV